jgi:excisionase family DNA binding protein
MLALSEGRALMLNIEDVADRLRVSESTIRGLVRRGLLRAYRIGGQRGQLRFKDEDVERYIDSTATDQPTTEDEAES